VSGGVVNAPPPPALTLRKVTHAKVQVERNDTDRLTERSYLFFVPSRSRSRMALHNYAGLLYQGFMGLRQNLAAVAFCFGNPSYPARTPRRAQPRAATE